MIVSNAEEGIIIFEFLYNDNEEILETKCREWLLVPELDFLVEQFDGKVPCNLDFKKRIHWLTKFSEVWDYRNRQKSVKDNKTGEKARWMIDSGGMKDLQVSAAMDAARCLGMIDCMPPAHSEYNYILVLGGARMSCLFRMKYAGILCEKFGIVTEGIAGLTGMRPIADTERCMTDCYAPMAATEFDLMCAAVGKVFDVRKEEGREEKKCKDMNSSWAIVKYKNRIPLIVLAAPSSNPEERRANTADTYEFWREKENVGKDKRLLIVTSQIYVPYQHLEAIRILGKPYGYTIETVGFPKEWSKGLAGTGNAANYLQEIRAALLSLQKLI